jgi:periplasmic protein TonB
MEDTMLYGTIFDRSGADSQMFASALESSSAERTRRAGTILSSFGLQALFTGVLLLLPLLRPMGLPSFHRLSTPISLGDNVTETPAVTPHRGSGIAPVKPAVFFFHRPSPLPAGRQAPIEEGAPLGSGPYISGAGSGDLHGLPGLLEGGTQPILPAAPPATITRPLQISHMNEGNLIRKVQPSYPALARSARIQGMVLLQAIISRQGTIENLSVMSGHPMLVPAAIDAVRQWRYRPYILNDEPVEVETQITVNFTLAGN